MQVVLILGKMLSQVIKIFSVVDAREILYMSFVQGRFGFSYIHDLHTFFAIYSVNYINSGTANVSFSLVIVTFDINKLLAYFHVGA